MSRPTVPPPSRSPRVPPGPRGHLLFGVTREVRADLLGFCLRMHREYGEIVRYRHIGGYCYQVNSPELIRRILHTHRDNYGKYKHSVSRFEETFGESMATTDGAAWLRSRRLAQPAFHPRVLATFDGLITGATNRMLDAWTARGEEPADIDREMKTLMLEVLGSSLFGLDLSREADDIGRAFAVISEEMFKLPTAYVLAKLLLPWLPLPTPRNPRFDQGLAQMNGVVQHIIDHRRRQGQSTGDLLSRLMSARDEETGEGMSDRQLHDEVISMLVAGHETTSLALAWTLYLLSQHEEVEDRLHRELDEVLGGRTPVSEDLPRLEYMQRVINESLRLYPPAHTFSRQGREDDDVDGYRIPAGVRVLIHPYVVHRHPEHWEEPERFDPDRFLPERSEARHPFAYLPFGLGPRTCVGKSFALLEIKLVLATLGQRFRLRVVPGHVVKPEPLITLGLRHGLRMVLHPR